MKKAVVFLCLLLLGAAVFGGGFQVYNEGSAEAMALAGAVGARDDLISLAWYNPAALAGSTNVMVQFNASFVDLNNKYSNSGGISKGEQHWRTIPAMYVVAPISEDLTGMLSVNAPYGLITEWNEDWYLSGLATKSELVSTYITPSLAYKLTDKLNIAASFNLIRFDAMLRRGNNLGLVGSVLGREREIEGDDWGYGWALSAHYDLTDDWALGFKYQSKVEGKLTGHADQFGGRDPVTASVDTPSSVMFGVANTSFEKWTLTCDALWTEWSVFDEIFIAGADKVPAEQNWGDVWAIRFGAEHQTTENLALRCGYEWDQSPVGDDHRSPMLPDNDRHVFAVGAGYEKGNWGVDVAFSYVYVEPCGMGTSVAASVPGSDGDFSSSVYMTSMGIHYKF